LSDSNGESATLTISVVDDTPVVDTVYKSLEEGDEVAVFNLVVVLDVSGSMDGSRLELAKSALETIVKEYDGLGDVNIQIVSFASSASKSSWYVDDVNGAIDYVNALSASGSTNYDTELNTTMTDFSVPDGGDRIFYFLSDGDPSSGGELSNTDITNWEAFVESEDAVAFGIGIGSGVSLDNLEPVAYPDDSEYALVVENESELAATLLSTIDASSISGNVSVLTSDGDVGIYVGADGGYISKIEIGIEEYTYTPGSSDATEITITTPEGANLYVNFVSGEYRYYVEIDQTIVGKQETFTVTATDNDGDSLSVDLVIDLDYEPNLDANRDTVISNSGDTVEIPVEALLHNDSGNSNMAFTSVAVGASGTVSASNGVVSYTPSSVNSGAFTNIIEDSGDSSDTGLNNSLNNAVDFSDRTLFGEVDAGDVALVADSGIPTARFQGTLTASNNSSKDEDWVKVYLAEGERLVLDIDGGYISGDGSTNNVDTIITLHDANGVELFENDDSSTSQGGDGSSSSLDSYLEYTATADGFYYINVTSYSNGDSGNYELWMSIESGAGEFDYTIGDGSLSNTTTADVSVVSGSTVQGTDDDEILVGDTGDDTLIGEAGDDALVGNAGDDTLQAGDGDDLLIGGAGKDELSGGLGADIFSWSLADAGSATTSDLAVQDTITDFDSDAFENGGDRINLSDLLVDEAGEDLTSYLHFERVDNGGGEIDTVLHVSSTGAFDGGNYAGSVEQSILLQGVDLLGASTDQQALIQDLISTGKLITD
jgi:uncharacterized protein YegL